LCGTDFNRQLETIFLGGAEMPYQVRVGTTIAIVANEKEALDTLRKMAASRKEEVSIRDIFGDEIDVAIVESRLAASE
jgi:hypothetical protein